MNDDWLALGCAILAIMLALIGIVLPESDSFPFNYPYGNLTGIPSTFPYGNLTGIPNTFPYSNVTGIPNTYPYGNLTGIPQSFPYGNLTGVPSTFPYGNLTGIPQTFPYSNLTGVPVVYNLTDGLVLWMPMDDGVGNASDYSGFMNHGAIYSASWVDGKIGKALSFDAVDDYVKVLYSPYVLFNSSFSFVVRVKVFGLGTIGSDRLFDKLNNDWNNGVDAYLGGSSFFTFRLITTTGFALLCGNFVLNEYVTFVYTWNSSFVSIYNNGVYHDGQALGGLLTSTQDLFLGTRHDLASSCFLNATVDEVRVYNRVLTQAEITLLYNLP